MVQKKHLIVAGLAFLMCLVAAYFGVKIQNANANFLLTELNEIDKIHFADVNEVPSISFKAALITAPLVLIILLIQLLIYKGTTIKKNKNIALGLILAVLIIISVDVMTLVQAEKMDFSHWGYVWICLGLFLIVGNVLSVFIERFSK